MRDESLKTWEDIAGKPVAEAFKGIRGVAEKEAIAQHIAINIKRGWAEHPWVQAHDGVALICGGGPSLKDRATLDRLRRMAAKPKHFVCSVNMTHDHFYALPSKKLGPPIKSEFAVLLDPKAVVSTYITPKQGPIYFIASQCNPFVLEAFEKEGIRKCLFHHESEAATPYIGSKSHAVPPVVSTVGLEAILILYRLGFRKFHLWGMESSYATEMRDGRLVPKELHAYAKPKEYLNVLPVEAVNEWTGERKLYLTNNHMSLQAEDFKTLVQWWHQNTAAWHEPTKSARFQKIEITAHGDGLLPASAAILHHKYPWVKHASLHSRLRDADRQQRPRAA